VVEDKQSTAEAQLVRVQAEGAAENSYLALISAMGISPMQPLLRERVGVHDNLPRERMGRAAKGSGA